MPPTESPPPAPSDTIGLLVEAGPGPGVLHQLSGVMARHGADITLVEILENRPAGSRTYFEVAVPGGATALEQDLAALPIVRRVTVVKTFQRIYGKRIIIMGGDIEKAVREIREQGVLVISLNMAGSVPESADLVVTDPVQAGVMAVMAVAETAQFSLGRLNRRSF